jgi:MFS family permease
LAFVTSLHLFFVRRFTRGALVSNPDFRRFWVTTVLSTFGHQITNLALPLTAVLLLHATPAQMGTLVALQVAPFALLSLPVGVWLDRRTKYPILLWSYFLFAFVLASVPVAWWLGALSMKWLYVVGFLTGTWSVIGGGAQQVFLTHLVGREHLIDAHSNFATTDSIARLLGPGVGGLLVQLLTAPFAILTEAIGFLSSAWILRGIRTRDACPAPSETHPVREMVEGLKFIRHHQVLWTLAWGIGVWQLLFNGYNALTVLFATRELHMEPGTLGTMQMLGGLGVLLSSQAMKPMSRRFGTGVTILIGLIGTTLAWILMPCIPAMLLGSHLLTALAYGAVIFLFDCSAMLLLMPYIALRQKVTPDEFLGRMTSTMRFLTVAAAPAGGLSAGWIAEHFGVRIGIAAIAACSAVLSVLLLGASQLRHVRN